MHGMNDPRRPTAGVAAPPPPAAVQLARQLERAYRLALTLRDDRHPDDDAAADRFTVPRDDALRAELVDLLDEARAAQLRAALAAAPANSPNGRDDPNHVVVLVGHVGPVAQGPNGRSMPVRRARRAAAAGR